MNNSSLTQEIHIKSGHQGIRSTLVFSRHFKNSDRRSSKPKFERCTCPNDLKTMAGELLTLIHQFQNNP